MKKGQLGGQVVKIDFLTSVEWLLESGERVTNKELARAVDESAGGTFGS